VAGCAALSLSLPSSLAAQEPAEPPVIDTVIVRRHNIFTDEEAAGSGVFRVMNKLHIVTHEMVIRNELLFRQGQPYDSADVAESERVLRNKRIFRELSIDTTTVDGRFAVVVESQDGWSTKPKFKFSVASDGTWTGVFGINEINLLGTGNQAYIAYEKDVDRDGLNLTTRFARMMGSEADLEFNYAGLSDGRNGNWKVGAPFRAFDTRRSAEYDGLSANQRVLQYRVNPVEGGGAVLDTTFFQRTAFTSGFSAAYAPRALATQYVRVGANVGIRREEFTREADSLAVIPDSLYATVGVWGEYSKARFWRLRRFNGFGTEDLDLSTRVKFQATLAPEATGFPSSGVGLLIAAAAAAPIKNGFVWAAVDANGLFNSAGLDSGRVVLNLSGGYKPAERHASILQVQLGILENPPPGGEFDLGFLNAPRSWQAHSFVGTRTAWGTFEHRWFAIDSFLKLVGIGFAGFIDYGGAWYDDQEKRFGGNVGVGLRLGSTLSTVPATGRLDIGYRFGDDADSFGERWVVAFGGGFIFPRRSIPVVSYRAAPPP
jgi:hypothetical protein